MVVVELKRAAERLEVGFLERRAQRVLVGKVALDGTHRAVDQQRGVVGLEGVRRRNGVVLFHIFLDECLVLRRVEIGRPIGAGEHAEGGVLLRRQRQFIDRERGQEGDLVGEAGLAELLDEVHAHAAGDEGKNRVRAGRGNARELGGVIELAKRHIHLVEDFAAEFVLEAGGRVLAGLIVRHDDDDLLEPGILGILAQNFVHLIVLIGGDEEIRVAVLAGEARCPGVGTDEDDVRLGDGLGDCAEDVGEDRTDHEIDLVAIDQRLDLGHGDVGLELVVGDDDLGLAAAELAAQILDRKCEAVAQLLAEHRRRAGQRGDDADFEIVLGVSGARPRSEHGRDGDERLTFDHVQSPDSAPRFFGDPRFSSPPVYFQ